MSLLRNRPTIQNIKVRDANINLEQNANGEYSVALKAEETENTDLEDTKEVKSPSKYPFPAINLGGVEIYNLNANIIGEKYSIADFNIMYMLRDAKREYSGWVKNGTKIFPFVVSFSEYNSERKVYPLSIAFTTGGTPLIANVALEGTSKMPIDFVIKGDVPDFAEFGRAIGRKWVDLPPMSVNASGGFGNKKITLRKSSIAIRGVNIDISGEYDWSKPIPNIVANVSAGDVVLTKIFPNLYGGTWVHPNRELNAFLDTPLYGVELSQMNLDVRVKIKSFRVYRELTLTDLDLKFTDTDKNGRIDLSVGIAGGDLKIASDFDVNTDGLINGQVAMDGKHIYVGQILSQVREKDFISELPVDIRGYFMAHGHDLSEIMQTITGPFQLQSSDIGYARSDLVEYIYGADTLTTLRHSVQDMFRSEKKYDQIKISCVTINTKLRNGVAETKNGVAVETGAINARLAGEVDLGH